MSRSHRSVHAKAFEHSLDFNEQVYQALRKSPWWMISIAAHVLLFVVSSLVQADAAAAVAAPAFVVTNVEPFDPLPDVTNDPSPIIDRPQPDDTNAQPTEILDAAIPVSDKDRIDTDSPFDETAGPGEHGTGDLVGPSTNPLMGLGGGAGGGKHGLGSNRTTRGGVPHGQPQQQAVDHALRWLAAHQSPDGGWEAAGFGRWDDGALAAVPASDGAGKAQHDTGVSGLAVLAFLGAGYTPRSEGPFGHVVGRGLRYLKNQQDAEGCFGARTSGHHVYSHAIAALAMVEAYGMTHSGTWKGPAQRGLDFIGISRNPYAAWRYGVKPGQNDTSVTGWMMMALKSAKLVNAGEAAVGHPPAFVIDEDAFDGIRSWVEKMTDPDTGRVGYDVRGSGPARPAELADRFPAAASESMTAVGILARVFLGENPKKQREIQLGTKLCAALPPRWDAASGGIDMYYWYYATLAMFQVGGDAWKAWDAAMKPAMVDSQRLDGGYGQYKGSWDPIDAWGSDGGRVYSTAVMAMCLEVYYRYDRVFTGGN